MTLITFDGDGNPTIKMDYKDVCPVSTEAYMRTLEQHVIDYSMVDFVTVETTRAAPHQDIIEYRRALIDCSDDLDGLVKITDYTVSLLPHNRVRLAGTGIVLNLEKFKELYSMIKKLQDVPDGTLEPVDLII